MTREPRIEDVLGGTLDALVVVRPRALRESKRFGALWERQLRELLTEDQGLSSTRLASAIHRSELVAIGLPRGADRSMFVMALRGVPFDLRPADVLSTTGDDGVDALPEALPQVQEYRASQKGTGLALFVLPNRSWVIVPASLVPSARRALERPSGNEAPAGLDGGVGFARLRGDALDQILRGHRDGAAQGIFGKLVQAKMQIDDGAGEGVRLELRYTDGDAAAHAAKQWQRVVERVDQPSRGAFGWLKGAKVTATDRIVNLDASEAPALGAPQSSSPSTLP